MTMAARVASGRSSNSAGEEQERDRRRGRRWSSQHCVLGLGGIVDRRLERSAVHHDPAGTGRPRRWPLRRPSSSRRRRCRSGSGTRRLRRCEALGEPHEHVRGPSHRREVVLHLEAVGSRGTAARCRCGRRGPRRGWPGRRRWRASTLRMTVEQLAGHSRRVRRRIARMYGERAGARPATSSHSSPRWATTCRSWRKKPPSPLLMPNSFGTWPMMIVRARPTMKPLSTGSEIRLARNPSAGRPPSSASTPVVMASAAVNAATLSRPAVASVATCRRRQRRGRGHGADDQVPRAAEQGVEEEGGRRGVEPDDGRDPGHGGVRERDLGHEHGPHREQLATRSMPSRRRHSQKEGAGAGALAGRRQREGLLASAPWIGHVRPSSRAAVRRSVFGFPWQLARVRAAPRLRSGGEHDRRAASAGRSGRQDLGPGRGIEAPRAITVRRS